MKGQVIAKHGRLQSLSHSAKIVLHIIRDLILFAPHQEIPHQLRIHLCRIYVSDPAAFFLAGHVNSHRLPGKNMLSGHQEAIRKKMIHIAVTLRQQA